MDGRKLHSESSMGGFVLLHSFEKMNVIPEETVLFFNLKDKSKKTVIREIYCSQIYLYVGILISGE